MFYYDVFSTPLGWFGLLLSKHGLRRSSLESTRDKAIYRMGPEIQGASRSSSELRTMREVVLAFVNGTGSALQRLPLDLSGTTPFARECLVTCTSIPVGETKSYLWIAKEMGRRTAARAVGRVMATNRLPVVIPCHRVVSNRGRLHGYSGGLDLKHELLRLEAKLQCRDKCG